MFKKAFPWSRREPDPADEGDAQFYVVGDMIVLRDKRLEDAANDYAWRRDPELSKLDATTPIKMPFKEYYRYAEDEVGYSSRWSRKFAIDTLDGKHIGNCMFYDIDLRRGETELGIMIGDREYWGKGYGADAVGTLLEYIFTTTSLTRVYLHTLDWNHRARKSFERAGFREVRTVRRSGMDFVLMEVLKPDWERRREQASRNGSAHDRKRAGTADT
ncbi:MAG: GNAT family N-acetyltransferase, partial [SAR202 cluster bacterium]|nr:GNAT family N-acetyltransferase [SAR202 cluster bacterium]